jgi:hypothetical protein
MDLADAGFSYDSMRNAGFPALDLQFAGFGSEDYGEYKWVSTTKAPLEANLSKVACAKGQFFPWDHLIPKMVPSFVGFPPQESWEQIWEKTFIAQHTDPCKAPIMAQMPMGEKKRGFGSDMNNFVNEALVAMYTRRPIAICAPHGKRNLWAESFIDPGLHRCSPCTLPPEVADVREGAWAAGAKTSTAEAGAGGERALSMVTIKRFLYKKLFVLRPELQQDLAEIQAKLGLSSGDTAAISHEGLRRSPYVGVHIRRGDKAAEGFFRPTEAFAVEAQRLCDAIGAKTVFLASDDASELAKLRFHIRTDIQVVEQPRLPAKTYAERGALRHSAEQVLINDIMLLIRADAYVGTASSNLDRFIWFQRDPAAQSISLDDGGDYLYRNC